MLIKKRKIFLILGICLITSNLFAKKLKIEMLSPSSLIQGQKDITLNIVTNQPMPQKSMNENLYAEVVFSSPYIRVKKVEFLNDRMINCVVDVDDFAELPGGKKIDVEVISFDENGEETVFEGKNLIEITRQAFINNIAVHTFDGRIKRGEKCSITIRGANFEKGKARVVLMMSGLRTITTDSPNTRQIRFELSAEDTTQLNPGKYNIYIYNKDGSGVKSEQQVEVVE